MRTRAPPDLVHPSRPWAWAGAHCLPQYIEGLHPCTVYPKAVLSWSLPLPAGGSSVCVNVCYPYTGTPLPQNRWRINNTRHNKWSFLTLKFLAFPLARPVVHIYCPPHHSSIFNHFLPILFYYANCLWLKISPDTNRSASIWEGGLDLTQKPVYALHIECKEMSKIFFLCSVKTNFPLIY